MSYRRTSARPGGRREQRLLTSSRSRVTRQLAVSTAIVAFAAGSVASAGLDGLGEALHAPAANTIALVAPVAAVGVETVVVTETSEVSLDHDSVETQDPYANSGTKRVVTEGKPGTALVTYDVTFVDGVEVSRVENLSVVVTPPTDEVIAVGSLVVPPSTPAQQGSNRALGQQMAADVHGWTGDQWSCLDNLWQRESGWRHTAANPSSSAYGIPQALPGNKMATAGADWQTNPATQITWGMSYIKNRYSTPCGAWSHFLDRNWY